MGISGSSEWESRWLGSPGLGAGEGIRRKHAEQEVSTWGLQWATNSRGIWGYGQAVAGGSCGKISTEKPQTRVEGLCGGYKVGLSGQMSVHHFGVV